MIAFAALARAGVAAIKAAAAARVATARMQRVGVALVVTRDLTGRVFARISRAGVAAARLTLDEAGVHDFPALDFSQASNSMYLGVI